MENITTWLDVAGISVFAASGALAAARKRLDFIAAWFFALVTATGGGTLRDLVIDAPVFWLRDPTPVLLCTIVAISAWMVPLRWWPDRALEWMDAAGLAAYSVYGASKALDFGGAPVPAIAAGVITACVGGIIRDVIAGIPSILIRHEIYVTASLLSASLYVLLTTLGVSTPLSSGAGFFAGFALRAAAIHWRLALPRHRGH